MIYDIVISEREINISKDKWSEPAKLLEICHATFIEVYLAFKRLWSNARKLCTRNSAPLWNVSQNGTTTVMISPRSGLIGGANATWSENCGPLHAT
jgi:hypothetical protein